MKTCSRWLKFKTQHEGIEISYAVNNTRSRMLFSNYYIRIREGIGSDASDHNIWSDDFQLVSIFFQLVSNFFSWFQIFFRRPNEKKLHKLKEFTHQLKEHRKPNERKTTQGERI